MRRLAMRQSCTMPVAIATIRAQYGNQYVETRLRRNTHNKPEIRTRRPCNDDKSLVKSRWNPIRLLCSCKKYAHCGLCSHILVVTAVSYKKYNLKELCREISKKRKRGGRPKKAVGGLQIQPDSDENESDSDDELLMSSDDDEEESDEAEDEAEDEEPELEDEEPEAEEE